MFFKEDSNQSYEKDSYLLELCRYVVLNPVRANMVEEPSAWRWSSFKVTATGPQVPEFLTVDWLLGQFSEKKEQSQGTVPRLCHGRAGGPGPKQAMAGSGRPDLSGQCGFRAKDAGS
jgi:putative transposase